MKKTMFLGFLMISTITFSQNIKSFKLEIQLDGFECDSISFYISNNGISAHPLLSWKTIPLVNQINTIIEREIQSVNLLMLRVSNDSIRKSGDIIVHPDGNYKIIFNKDSKTPDYEGLNSEGNKEFSEIKTPFLCRGSSEKYIKDSIKFQLLCLLNQNIESDLEPFDGLLSYGKIEQRFYDDIKTIISTNQSYQLIKTIQFRHRLGLLPPSDYKQKMLKKMTPLDIYSDGYIKSIDSLFQVYPFSANGALLSPRSQDYLECYLYHLSFKDSIGCKEFDKDCIIDIAKENLSAEFYELSFANTFGYFFSNDNINSINIRYNLFEENFPNSLYLSKVKSLKERDIAIKQKNNK